MEKHEIIRTKGSTALFVCIAVICLIGLGSIVVGDLTMRGLAVAGIPAAALILVYGLYRFPRVELRNQELALVNPLQTVTVPWNLVDSFDTHFGLAVVTHEKSFSSWPLAGKGKKMEKDANGIRQFVDHPNPAVDAVLDHFAGLGDGELSNPGGRRTITKRWNTGLIAAMAAGIAWAVIGFSALPS